MAEAVLFVLMMLAMAVATTASVYEVLSEYGLPIGLLPPTVTSYSLSEQGAFEVHLSDSTYCKFEDQVYYEKKITGVLSYGTIKSLSGIKAKQAIFWLSVTGISVDGPYIVFEVGLVSKKLSLSLFQTVPSCTLAQPPQSFRISSWLEQALLEKVDINEQLEVNAPNRKLARTI